VGRDCFTKRIGIEKIWFPAFAGMTTNRAGLKRKQDGTFKVLRKAQDSPFTSFRIHLSLRSVLTDVPYARGAGTGEQPTSPHDPLDFPSLIHQIAPTSFRCRPWGRVKGKTVRNRRSPATVRATLPAQRHSSHDGEGAEEGIATSVTVITRDQIARSQAVMAVDVLREVPGLDVVRSGGEGQQVSLFLRGTNSYQALVLIDGVEVNDPSSPNNAFNPAHLEAADIERIEVLRGPQSVLYGSDAVGGVIQIFTRRGVGNPGVAATLEGGSFGSSRERVALGYGNEQVDYVFAINNVNTDGVSAIAEWRGNSEADGYKNTSYSGSFGLRPVDGIHFRLSGGRSQAKADLDKTVTVFDDPNYELESRDNHLSARLSYTEPHGYWTGQVGAYVTHYERWTRDLPDADHPGESEETHYRGRRLKFDWQNGLKLHQANHLTFGVETEKDRMEQDLFFASSWGDYASRIDEVQARSTGLYALDQLNLDGLLIVGVGARHDDHELFGGHTTYRITGALVLDRYLGESGFGLKLRGSYGTGFKAPSLAQLYDPTYGNTDLKPETSEGWEIGFDLIAFENRVQCGVTWFDNTFEDLIAYDANTFKNMNIDSSTSQGAELYATLAYEGVTIRGDYTYTKAEDKTTGELLLRRPKNKAGVTTGYRLIEKLDVQASVLYVGARDDMDYTGWPSQRVSLDSYTVVNLAAGYKVWPQVRVYGRVENLFDKQYEEAFTYGAPGRGGYVGVTAGVGE